MPIEVNHPSADARAHVTAVLEEAVARARRSSEGVVASYIPELGAVDPERTSAAIVLPDGHAVLAGDAAHHRFTLQSAAKVLLLAGVLEEVGPERVFSTVGSEPSGESFASIARLDSRGPLPANPLVNAGAIALCGIIPGTLEGRIAWIESWAQRLCGAELRVSSRVYASERRTGDRNRSIAYLLRSSGILTEGVDDPLDAYFSLCSLEGTVAHAAHLGCVLAHGGISPAGTRVLSEDTTSRVVALMASCGMYDESGTYLMQTGLPAKSGVSGVIVAVALGRAGVAVSSPRLNARGGSVRGHLILEHVAHALGWHFARPRSTE
ncbi:glutaminase A [Paraliomyxa miuraensis]|uniref:glutaminase A n=1 Tax=Paraliomyxa miuraensis TaxID=376150 RepID=UPI002252430E|nr:glutaminase A [Paraliomyxa miuraensis]MCX4243884.1 glutaminase A [Paraliomyxa miuraensis]